MPSKGGEEEGKGNPAGQSKVLEKNFSLSGPGKLSQSYPYVVCRGCGSSLHLIKGVKEVIGLIGGDVDYYRTDGERVYVSLWSEAQKQARNADIDLLEIRNSSGITYDYAINAVLQTLKNDVSRPAEYVKGIPVILTDNPPLSENARRILEDEFGGIKQDA